MVITDDNVFFTVPEAIAVVEATIKEEPWNTRAKEYLAFLKHWQVEENRKNIKLVPPLKGA